MGLHMLIGDMFVQGGGCEEPSQSMKGKSISDQSELFCQRFICI